MSEVRKKLASLLAELVAKETSDILKLRVNPINEAMKVLYVMSMLTFAPQETAHNA